MEVVGLLRRHHVDELVMTHTPASKEILNLVALCREQAIRVSLVPQPYELYLSRPRLLDLGGLPLLQLGEAMPLASARIGERLLEAGARFCFGPRHAPRRSVLRRGPSLLRWGSLPLGNADWLAGR